MRIFGAFARRAGYEVADLRRAIDDTRPDCLIVDITTAGAAAAAEASGLPWARWIPFLGHASFDPAPSYSIDFLPYSLLPGGLDVVNDARAAVGLPALASPDDGWRAAVELYLTAEPFELPGLSYPESFRLVGPGVWEPAAAPIPWLDEMEGPLVLVTASSEKQGDDGLVRTAVEALGGTDLAVAISTAATRRISSPLPATCGSSAGSRTCRSCNAPPPSSATAAWASPRRRWPRAYRCAWCRSGETSSR